jgi:transketolase
VLCGDSELAEGSIWEALDKAAYYRLSNLIAIVDINRLGQRGPTELGWDLDAYARRAEAFGARTLEIDGHDLGAIDQALATAEGNTSGAQPTVVLARTVKGKGFAEVENRNGWHGKPFPPDMAGRAIAELGGVRNLVVRGPRPAPAMDARPEPATADAPLPRYAVGDKVATRQAYGDALVALGARDPLVVALDAEVSNSTDAEEFAHTLPDRYFEMFIAEQQLVAAATGLSVRGYRAFASTFAAFLPRAHDFIRMGAISGVDLRLVGSHAGVEIGADGPSQMGLEDLAMLRAIHGSTVLYPSDATSTAALVAAMASTPGISYLRTTRGAYPVLYPAGEAFWVGGSKVLRAGDHDQVILVAPASPCTPAGRRRDPRRGGRPGPGDRLLLGQADRHRHPRGGGGRHRRADRGRRGPPPRGRAGRGRQRRPAGRRPVQRRAGAPGRARDAGLRIRRGAAGMGRPGCRPHRRRRPQPAESRLGVRAGEAVA